MHTACSIRCTLYTDSPQCSPARDEDAADEDVMKTSARAEVGRLWDRSGTERQQSFQPALQGAYRQGYRHRHRSLTRSHAQGLPEPQAVRSQQERLFPTRVAVRKSPPLHISVGAAEKLKLKYGRTIMVELWLSDAGAAVGVRRTMFNF
eukprot:GHVU01224437.1.p1 GENE.GHVU01224437.1~~GHVU01224437.1.p1  ORF type:complete len:149 (+),score=2.20 GHVU01224437.1:344-790(+)